MFWGDFFEKVFLPSVLWSLRKFSKIKKNSKLQKCPKSFPKLSKFVLNMFCDNFFEKKSLPRVPWRTGLSKISKKNQKSFKIPKVPKIVPEIVQTSFELALEQYFRKIFCPVFPAGHFRSSGLELMSSESRNSKKWVQFSGLINMSSVFRHNTQQSFFCINATVKVRISISDFLDSKLWVQIPELKNMCSVFWTKTIWNRFSGLKIRGRYLEKIQEKNQEGFKVLKLSKIVLKCPNVFWSIFFEKKNFPQCSMEVRVSEKFQKSKKAQNRSQKYSNVFWTCFEAIFMKKFFCPVFHGVFKNFRKIPNFSIIQKCPKSFPILTKLALNMFWGIFSEKKSFAQCSMDGRAFENFRKKPKKFQNSKSAKNRSHKSPNVFWTCFGPIFRKFFCPVFQTGLFRFSRLENMSSVLRNNTQQTFFLHSRHSQYTQSHFRFSGLKIMNSDSRT